MNINKLKNIFVNKFLSNNKHWNIINLFINYNLFYKFINHDKNTFVYVVIFFRSKGHMFTLITQSSHKQIWLQGWIKIDILF